MQHKSYKNCCTNNSNIINPANNWNIGYDINWPDAIDNAERNDKIRYKFKDKNSIAKTEECRRLE